MTFDDAVHYLLSLGHETLALKLGLETTEVLLSAVGDPQTFFPSVQIAGTNGKGSTAVVLDSIARAAGIKTGLFTSPHLRSITERIRINGQDLSQSGFAGNWQRLFATARTTHGPSRLTAAPTFFEQVTAIALLAFQQANVDLAILETGLGGRLDSTTVARAETIGITQIALDHQEYLGNTLAEIAAEKAAIIRPNVTAVIAPQAPAALDLIMQRCANVEVTPRVNGCQTKIIGATGDGRMRVTLKPVRTVMRKSCSGFADDIRLQMYRLPFSWPNLCASAALKSLARRSSKESNRPNIRGGSSLSRERPNFCLTVLITRPAPWLCANTLTNSSLDR